MEIMEIVLLVVGAIIFIASFLIPVKQKDTVGQEVVKENVKEIIEQELKTVKGNLNDAVEESTMHAVEKTERSMERLSNEKIMAIDEYSQTVLDAIHKNHNEVMFLYDMLNDKQKNIMTTVKEVDKTVKEAGQAGKESEISSETTKEDMPEERPMNVVLGQQNTMFDDEDMFSEGDKNSNRRILELHEEGKSQVDIAKELGLGVGEVKLVIDLFEGM